jgi:Ankyrin repeats (3 copies)
MDETRVNNNVTFDLIAQTFVEPSHDVVIPPTNGNNHAASLMLAPGSAVTSSTAAVRITPRPSIVAIEEEDTDEEGDDVIPGPSSPGQRRPIKSKFGLVMDGSNGSQSSSLNNSRQIGMSIHTDIHMPADEFAEGCKLLQAAALGNLKAMNGILKVRPNYINFRDYDRRTALHVAASEGHLPICKYLVDLGAKINRSDRWGGSPLDDATRHRHKELIAYLRSLGAIPGSANKLTNFIKAAADGDYDEVEMLLMTGEINIDEGDYGKSREGFELAIHSMEFLLAYEITCHHYK